jgi:hypothetical protein
MLVWQSIFEQTKLVLTLSTYLLNLYINSIMVLDHFKNLYHIGPSIGSKILFINMKQRNIPSIEDNIKPRATLDKGLRTNNPGTNLKQTEA